MLVPGAVADASPGGSTVNKTDVVPALSGGQDGQPRSKQVNKDSDKGISDSELWNAEEKPP